MTEEEKIIEYMINKISVNEEIRFRKETTNKTNAEEFLRIENDFIYDFPAQEYKFIECTESAKPSIAFIEKIRRKKIKDIIKPVFFDSDFIRNLLKIEGVNQNLKKFTIRHYTSGDPKKFSKKIKSNLTLTADLGVPITGGSGHTNGYDWNQIGNVGDTFYSLFFDGEPATGKTPAFIKDALFYIEWSLEEFGDCWASGDWLSYADKGSITTIPPSYSGSAYDVLFASLLNNPFEKSTIVAKAAITTALTNGIIDSNAYLKTTSNFEIKKHGSKAFTKYFDIKNNHWVKYDIQDACWKYFDEGKDNWVEWDSVMNHWKYFDKKEDCWKYYDEKDNCWKCFWK